MNTSVPDDAPLNAAEERALQAAVNLVKVIEANLDDPKVMEWLQSDDPGAARVRGLRAHVKALEAAEALEGAD